MQGDIFQLHQVQDQDLKKSKQVRFDTTKALPKNPQPQTPFVSIYNEDDLTHYLYQRIKPLEDAELSEAYNHAHYLGVIAAAFDDYCSDTSHDYSDESAEHTEDEDEILTPKDDEYAGFHPAVVKKQLSTISSLSDSKKAQINHKACENTSSTMEIQPVSRIEGPMMSWWPLPMESREYAWAEKEKSEKEGVVPECQHVSEIEGSCMSWWPLPMDMQERDWNERFYE